MKPGDIVIENRGCAYRVTVVGRANFDYAVPLREVVNGLDDFGSFVFDLTRCVTMDSTFMGVLTMLALKGYQKRNPVELWGAGAEVAKLLKELGIAKLFVFKEGAPPPLDGAASCSAAGESGERDQVALAETVAEAHRKLVEAEPANAPVFESVIRYADADVERLKKTPKEE